ncbi:MAG TPA: hypothetical protein VD994_19525, partial [Prosthecobacter sp.]|nr:hypothetical protein [Prosthecobacter sp.]
MKLLVPLKKSALCLFLAAFVWSGCDRKKEPAAEAPSRAAAPGASAATADAAAGKPVAAANPLIANADRLGMAGRMPKDTGLYLGSANLKAHCDALKKTQYWKTIEAFRQDSKPSETKKKKASKLPEFEDLEIDDFFMAMSKDSKAHMAWLIDLNRVYGEYTYRTMMTGFTGGGGAGAFDPQAMLANASASPEMIERICSLLERAEMLPLLAGAKTPQAQQLLDAIAPANADERPEWTRTLTPGTFTANTGAKLTTYEGTLGIWLTPAVREEWLAGIQKSITQEALVTRIKQTLETLAAKKFVIGA